MDKNDRNTLNCYLETLINNMECYNKNITKSIEQSNNVSKQLPDHINHVLLDNSEFNQKKTYLNVDSRCRKYGTPNSFSVDIPRQENIRKICLETAEIPNAILLISADRGNNTFYVSFNSAPYVSVVIPDGSYDYINFTSTLETLLQAIDVNFSVSIDVGSSTTPSTYKMTITNTTHTFSINFGTSLTTQDLLQNNLGDIMGFLPIVNNAVYTYTSVLVSGDYVLVSPSAVNLEGENYIYILLKNVEGYLFDCYSNLSHFKIPVTTSTGSIVFYTNNTDYNSMLYQKDNQMTLTNLSVELKSSWGGTLDNSNKEWSFMLSFIKY